MDDFDFVQCEEFFEDRWDGEDFDIEEGTEF